ncbi:hypothetical protein HPB47_022366 [Ixodes persulcatus]|uniref:Uncharacterized protein n=1 Tax=Ixodes persulcatus TaxID=34615 RepID=A0AC60Q9X8_IXOPE|nr:hypothetical protein HPB47_022366 [Ixodes persulcatus]
MRDLYALAHFPGVFGCIDSTHVRIKNPGGDNAEAFRNRKGTSLGKSLDRRPGALSPSAAAKAAEEDARHDSQRNGNLRPWRRLRLSGVGLLNLEPNPVFFNLRSVFLFEESVAAGVPLSQQRNPYTSFWAERVYSSSTILPLGDLASPRVATTQSLLQLEAASGAGTGRSVRGAAAAPVAAAALALASSSATSM